MLHYDLNIKITKDLKSDTLNYKKEKFPKSKRKLIKNPKSSHVCTQAKKGKKAQKINDQRNEYEVKDIIRERTNSKDKTKKYKVKWVEWTKPTWKPTKNLENAQDIVTTMGNENKGQI